MIRNPVKLLAEETSDTTEASANKTSVNIRIITHNIRYATQSPFKGEELWSVRCPRLCSQLIFNSFAPGTFICMQEVLHPQLIDVLTALNRSSPPDDQWLYVGVGRDDGEEAGEYSPILYRSSVWTLEKGQTIWLSETPDVPSKGWDADSIRIVTIGTFIHVEAGNKVSVLNTHFDNAGAVSRQESANMILRFIKYLTMDDKPSAILLAGDFNSPPDDEAYKIMTGNRSFMEDIRFELPAELRYGNEMTFTSFGYVDNEPSRIDFIFSRNKHQKDKIVYRNYGVLANRFDDGVYLSDHRAVVADLMLSS